MEHTLKTWIPLFQDVLDRKKVFEIRKNDRGFKVKDTLILKEYAPIADQYTGREARVLVLYICDIPHLDNYVGMSIVLMK